MSKRKRESVRDDEEEAAPAENPEQGDSISSKSRKSLKKSKDELIKSANSLSIEEFEENYVDSERLIYSSKSTTAEYSISLKTSSDLTTQEFTSCFNLISTTSRADYEASTSFGWHPKRKKREMKEREMRYLLVRSSHTSHDSRMEGKDPIIGFLSFMLTHDSSPVLPVLYIYEIHLDASVRGCGLGAHLMRTAEDVARRVAVRKVMLTCFVSNAKAMTFYSRHGFDKDACSPEDRWTREKVIKGDYMILSKVVAPATAGPD